MAERINIPVLVGGVPLLAVTSLAINEGYKAAAIAGSSLTQMVAPTTKTITIEALLFNEFRALRPALEGMALASRPLASASGPLMKFTGVPVVAKTSVHVDMQITSLVFTQDNQMRDTLRVSMSLTQAPRAQLTGLIGGGLDLVVGAATAFI
jgi:low affinity Fe/Cu permease